MIQNTKYTCWKIDGNVSWVSGIPDFSESDFREVGQETLEQQELRSHPDRWALGESQPPCATSGNGAGESDGGKSCRRCEEEYRRAGGLDVSGAFCAWWPGRVTQAAC